MNTPRRTDRIRKPAVAGLFYPDRTAELEETVSTLVKTPVEATDGAPSVAPKALIAPHAGYIYSGPTAGAAFREIQPFADQIRRVVLIGPSHRHAFRGLALPTATALATPLGIVSVDLELSRRVLTLEQVQVNDRAHQGEHSLEVELPFLQWLLTEFEVLPLTVGDAAPGDVAEVLEAVWGGPETLIVISSDLSHYLPYDQARALDQRTADAILALDGTLAPEHACGARALNGFLVAARQHHLKPELLRLENSGDTAGDRQRVVGYSAFAFYPT
jgi:hypothetical protein